MNADDEVTFRVLPFPHERNIVLDVMEQGSLRHHVWGFGSLDVTRPRQLIAAVKENTGESLSFTAHVVHCVATALGEHKEVQAIKVGKRLYVFDDVDVSTMIEKETRQGKKVPANYIVRSANRKSYREIHDEIRAAKGLALNGIALGDDRDTRLANLFCRMPKWIRNLVWWRVNRDPLLRKKLLGTAQVSSVGMFVNTGGWALTRTVWSIAVIVGGIARRPGVVEGRVEVRDFVDLTLSVDHDIVDGGPAARFAQRFASLLQSAAGIEAAESSASRPGGAGQ